MRGGERSMIEPVPAQCEKARFNQVYAHASLWPRGVIDIKSAYHTAPTGECRVTFEQKVIL
jgi:hypothetical protein